jgi:general secretion pathway protein M
MAYDPRQLIGSVTSRINRMAPRERLFLGIAVLSTVVLVLYLGIWDPLQTNREQLTRRIAAKEKDLAEMQRLRDMYLDVQRRFDANRAAFSTGEFNLFAYLQGEISQAVSKEHIISMNPSTKKIGTEYQEEMVEIKLQQLSLPQIVDLVYRVEKGEHPLRFSRLQIKKRFNDIWNFDVGATVSLLKAAGAS